MKAVAYASCSICLISETFAVSHVEKGGCEFLMSEHLTELERKQCFIGILNHRNIGECTQDMFGSLARIRFAR